MYKVLFVDDDPAIGFIVSKFSYWKTSEFQLEKMVMSGQEALDELDGAEYDLVITDIRMPVMDGIELLTEIRKRNLKTSVVLCSTYTDFQYAREGMRLGALDYLSKPLTEDKLREELEFVRQFLFGQKNEESHTLDVMANIGSARQNQLFESILSMDERVDAMLEEIIEELEEQNEADDRKRACILKLLLENIWKQMLDKFPWLDCVSQLEIEVSGADCRTDAKQTLAQMKQIVEQFQIYRYDSVVNSICSLLTEHMEREGVIEIISEKLELSPDYIRVLFKNKTGINFNKFFTLLKMEYAKKLLKQTNLKIYEISEKCGYGTIDYFTKLFKTHTGLTPVQYRKAL